MFTRKINHESHSFCSPHSFGRMRLFKGPKHGQGKIHKWYTNLFGDIIQHAQKSSMRKKRVPLRGRAAANLAYGTGNKNLFDNNTSSVPFNVADISGRLRRVNVDGADYAVISRVKEPPFGSNVARNTLFTSVSSKVAGQTGCAFQHGIYTKRANNVRTGFIVPIDCSAITSNHEFYGAQATAPQLSPSARPVNLAAPSTLTGCRENTGAIQGGLEYCIAGQ